MEEYKLPIKQNLLKTKEDLQRAFTELTDPLKAHFSKGSALLHIGDSSAGYPDSIAEFEGFSRVLWGLAPFTAGGGNSELWNIYIDGIRNGTNPLHEEYWGKVNDYDQRLVEMAALGLVLVLAPEKIWEPLTTEEKNNFSKWLSQINGLKLCDCNWVLFAVMVNLGLKSVGENYDIEKMNWALDRIEEFYIGDSWYSDGINGHSDYYIPFAIHYYCLIYAKIMEKEDTKRSELYKQRAADFAKDFIYWFAKDGSALPYGRSLTYRFAQAGFWSALVFAGVEVFPSGVIKGIILRNLRWWFKQPIFNNDGTLTIGYAYPNLIMAENYNSPGSPYWALKTFLILALNDNGDFWTSTEEELPELEELAVQKKPHLVICRNKENDTVMAFNSGHLSTNEHTHTSAKYEKFVYSNTFGFSVPRAEWGIGQAAADSMLALSEEDNIYRIKRLCEEYKIEGNIIYSRWKPWKDVQVETRIICGNPWHIRIHIINSLRNIDAADGGFALGLHNKICDEAEYETLKTENGVFAKSIYGISGIVNMYGYEKEELIYPNCDTNLIHSRTVIPTLLSKLKTGKHCLISAVCGSDKKDLNEIKSYAPYLKKIEDEVYIFSADTGESIINISLK
ncbi:DUF2264 domain-containing protein [Clostridium sp. 19966]|uniref:DUF2264 domain-containing protein n=1 Tax=Clostridium sp. 19966 TaxID=2768166 RepID=UPI0028DFEC6E|nr:DUF2264 domain-containing protein [Clostridium sp. 19966]MDT8717549.1 DUF2264 domain-containing protein [Clostridium sp. 19966]